MLAVTSYPQEYVDECRSRMEAQLTAYKRLASAAAEPGTPASRSAVESFGPLFFANLTLVLDSCFMHRTRAIEGKDGNPMNEVRMLCTSILLHGGVLQAEKSIKYKPETSVLGLEIGDEIRLDETQFRKLADAYFATVEAKFT